MLGLNLIHVSFKGPLDFAEVQHAAGCCHDSTLIIPCDVQSGCGIATKILGLYYTKAVLCCRKYFQWEHSFQSIGFSAFYPNSKVDGAKMGPIWGRQAPGGPHVGPMNFAIWVSPPKLLWHSLL